MLGKVNSVSAVVLLYKSFFFSPFTWHLDYGKCMLLSLKSNKYFASS